MEIETLLEAVRVRAVALGGWTTAPTVHWWADFKRKDLRDESRGLSALIVPAEGTAKQIARNANKVQAEVLVDVAVTAPLTAADETEKASAAADVVGQAEGLAESFLGTVLTETETTNQAVCREAALVAIIDPELAREGRLLVSMVRMKFFTVRG